MNRLTVEQVHARTVVDLGLAGILGGLTADISIAASIRRVAGLLCPCSFTTIAETVTDALRGLTQDHAVRERVEELLQAVISHGDLQEHHQITADAQHRKITLIYPAPPTFVARASGSIIVLGCAPDGQCILSDALERRIQHTGYVRRLESLETENLAEYLKQLGLVELSDDRWLSMPQPESASSHVARCDDMLDKSVLTGSCDGWLLIEPSRPVRFYKGRWVECTAQRGRFVARRPQAYGADVWCYAQVADGQIRFIDLPLTTTLRGCDEAWRLQMAIDRLRGAPQEVRLSEGPVSTVIVECFSPLPLWVRRRWNALGEEVQRPRCLFAYRLPRQEWPEEEKFVTDVLWLAQVL